MTRLVADAASNSHPVAALSCRPPISRLRRARAQESGTILFFGFWSQAKSRSALLDPPELIGLRKIGGALVLRRPLSRLLPVRFRRSHISRRRSAAFGPRQRPVPSGFGRHLTGPFDGTTMSVSNLADVSPTTRQAGSSLFAAAGSRLWRRPVRERRIRFAKVSAPTPHKQRPAVDWRSRGTVHHHRS
jgi:hypothetical protein